MARRACSGMSGFPTRVSLMSPGIACSSSQTSVRKATKRMAIWTRRPNKNLNIGKAVSSRWSDCSGRECTRRKAVVEWMGAGPWDRPPSTWFGRLLRRHRGLQAAQELEAGEGLGERILDPVVVELQDAGIEQRDMRLVASDQPLHLPHGRKRIFLGLSRVECIRCRVELLVRVLGVVRVTTRAEERAMERREGRVPQRVAEDEHVER